MFEQIINFVFEIYLLYLITKILKLCDWIYILNPFKFIFHIIYVIILCDLLKIYYILHIINFIYVLDILNQLLIIIIITLIIDRNKRIIKIILLNILSTVLDFIYFKCLH